MIYIIIQTDAYMWHACAKLSKATAGGQRVTMLVDNFGIQVDADIEFNGDECANLKCPVGYHHYRKHPHFCIVNSSLYVATQSIVILSQ